MKAIPLILTICLIACTPHSVREAESVVTQADSLWQAGKMYGVDEGDSVSLAQAYETLQEHSAFSRQLSEVCPFVLSLRTLYIAPSYIFPRLLPLRQAASSEGQPRSRDAGLHRRHPFPHARLPYPRARI